MTVVIGAKTNNNLIKDLAPIKLKKNQYLMLYLNLFAVIIQNSVNAPKMQICDK